MLKWKSRTPGVRNSMSEQPSLPEQPTPPHPYTIFAQGMAHGPEMTATIQGEFAKQNAGDRISFWRSDLKDSVEQKQANIDQQVDEVVQKLSEGPVRIMSHSLGAVRVERTVAAALAKEPKLADNLHRLELVFVSPGGFFEGVTRDLKLIQRVWRGDVSTLTDPVMRHIPSFERGIDSLAFIPIDRPSSTDNASGEIPPFADRLRQVFPDISQEDSAYRLAKLDPTIDYTETVSPEDKAKLKVIDDKLRIIGVHSELQRLATDEATALKELGGKKNDIKKLVSDRGQLLAPYLLKAFMGEYHEGGEGEVAATPEAKPAAPEAKTRLQRAKELGREFWADDSTEGQRAIQIAQGFLGVASMTKDILDMKPLQQARELQAKGAKIRFFVPEYDGFFNVKDIPEGLDSDITILELTMHASWYFRPESMVQALKAADTNPRG